MSWVRVRLSSNSMMSGSSWRAGRLVVANRDRRRATVWAPVRTDPPATTSSLAAAAGKAWYTGSYRS